MVKLAFLIIIIPSLAMAECLSWIRCPYVAEPNQSRRISLPQRISWDAIEVAGNQALVCLHDAITTQQRTDAGCVPIGGGGIRPYMIPPDEPYWDDVAQEIRFKDGQEGREKKERPFNDRALMRKFRKDAEFQRGVPKEADGGR